MTARPNGGASRESRPKKESPKTPTKRNIPNETETRFKGSDKLLKISLERVDVTPYLNKNNSLEEHDTVSNEANKKSNEATKQRSIPKRSEVPDKFLLKCSVALFRENLKKLQDALSKKVAVAASSKPTPVNPHRSIKGNLKINSRSTPDAFKPKKRVSFSEKVTVIEMREYHKCKKCPRIFDTRKMLKVHTKKLHKKNRQYICNYCLKCFMDRSFFKVHIKLHCSFCGLLLPSKAKCLEHKRTVCRVLHKCESCDKTFYKLKHLREHSYEHTKPQLFCDYCKDKFTTKCAIAHHIKFLHSKRRPKCLFETRSLGTDRLYLCNFCDECTVDREIIEKHLRPLPDLSNRIIKGQQGYYFCDQCKKDFITETEMLEHKWTHFLKTSELQESNEDLQDLESIINSNDLIQDTRQIITETLDDSQDLESISNDDLEDITQIITESQDDSLSLESNYSYEDRSQNTTPSFSSSDDSRSIESINNSSYRSQDVSQKVAVSNYDYQHIEYINTSNFASLNISTNNYSTQMIQSVNNSNERLASDNDYQHIEFINNSNFGTQNTSACVANNPDDSQHIESGNSFDVSRNIAQSEMHDDSSDSEGVESVNNFNDGSPNSVVSITESFEDTQDMEAIANYNDVQHALQNHTQRIVERCSYSEGMDSVDNFNDGSQISSISITASFDEALTINIESINNCNHVSQNQTQALSENHNDSQGAESVNNLNGGSQDTSTSATGSHNDSHGSQVIQSVNNPRNGSQNISTRLTASCDDSEIIESVNDFNDRSQNTSASITESLESSSEQNGSQNTSISITESLELNSEHIESIDKPTSGSQNILPTLTVSHDDSDIMQSVNNFNEVSQNTSASITESFELNSDSIEPIDNPNSGSQQSSNQVVPSNTASHDDSDTMQSVNNFNAESQQNASASITERVGDSEAIKSIDTPNSVLQKILPSITTSHDNSELIESVNKYNDRSQEKSMSIPARDHFQDMESVNSASDFNDGSRNTTPVITDSNNDPEDISKSIDTYNKDQNLPDIVLDSRIRVPQKPKEIRKVDNERPEILSNTAATQKTDGSVKSVEVRPVIYVEKMPLPPLIPPAPPVCKSNIITVYKLNEIPAEMLKPKVVLQRLKLNSKNLPWTSDKVESNPVYKINKKPKTSPTTSPKEKVKITIKKSPSPSPKEISNMRENSRKCKLTPSTTEENKHNKRRRMSISDIPEEKKLDIRRRMSMSYLSEEKVKINSKMSPQNSTDEKLNTVHKINKKCQSSPPTSPEKKIKINIKIPPSTTTEENSNAVHKINKISKISASVSFEEKVEKSREITTSTLTEENSNTVHKVDKKSKTVSTSPIPSEENNKINITTSLTTTTEEKSNTVQKTNKLGEISPSKTSKQKSISVKKDSVTSKVLPENVSIPADETMGYVSTSVNNHSSNQKIEGRADKVLSLEDNTDHSNPNQHTEGNCPNEDAGDTDMIHHNQNSDVHHPYPSQETDVSHPNVNHECGANTLNSKDPDAKHPDSKQHSDASHTNRDTNHRNFKLHIISNQLISTNHHFHNDKVSSCNQSTDDNHRKQETHFYHPVPNQYTDTDTNHSNRNHDTDANHSEFNHRTHANHPIRYHYTDMPHFMNTNFNHSHPGRDTVIRINHPNSLSLSPLSLSSNSNLDIDSIHPDSNQDIDSIHPDSNQMIHARDGNVMCEETVSSPVVEDDRDGGVSIDVQADCLGDFGHLKKLLTEKKTRKTNFTSKHQCLVCGKYFSTSYCVRRHIRDVHNNTESLQCMLCEEVFVWPSLLHSHKCIRLQHPEMPFQDARPEIHFDNLAQGDGTNEEFGDIGIIENNSLAVDFEIPEPAVRYRQQLGQTELNSGIVETQNGFVHTPPHLEENTFVHTPPHSFVTPPYLDENSFVHTPPHQIDGPTSFVHTSPHHTHLEVDVHNNFVHTPPHQVHQSDAQTGFVNTPPHQIDAQNGFINTPPHQVDAQNSYVQTPPHQLDGQNGFMNTPPHQGDAQNCFVQSSSPSHFAVQCLPPVVIPNPVVPSNVVHIPIETNPILHNQLRRNDMVLQPQRDIFVQTPNGLSNMVFTVNRDNFANNVNQQNQLQNTFAQNRIVQNPFTQNIVQSPFAQNALVQNPPPFVNTKIPVEQLQRMGYRVIMQEVPIEF